MAGTSSGSAVVWAITGNAFLTVSKFVAYFLSGSGAMLAEAIHSLADFGNQALLYIGIKTSARAANKAHPLRVR